MMMRYEVKEDRVYDGVNHVMCRTYKIVDKWEKDHPYKNTTFPQRKRAEEIVDFLNGLASQHKKRFELIININQGGHPAYLLWDNLEDKPIRYVPNMSICDGGDGRVTFFKKYIDFLNELYEETPINQ